MGGDAPVKADAPRDFRRFGPGRKRSSGGLRRHSTEIEARLAELEVSVQQPGRRAQRRHYEHGDESGGDAPEGCHVRPSGCAQGQKCQRRGSDELWFDEMHGEDEKGKAEKRPPRPSGGQRQPDCERCDTEDAGRRGVFDDDVVGVLVEAIGADPRQLRRPVGGGGGASVKEIPLRNRWSKERTLARSEGSFQLGLSRA